MSFYKKILFLSVISVFIFQINLSICTANEIPQKQKYLKYEEPEQVAPVKSGGIILKMLFSLFCILLMIVLCLLVLKKILGNTYASFGGKSIIKVLDKSYLEPKKSVCVLKILDKILILGVHQNGFTPISEFQDNTLNDVIKDSDEKKDYFEYLSVDDREYLQNGRNTFFSKIKNELNNIKKNFKKVNNKKD